MNQQTKKLSKKEQIIVDYLEKKHREGMNYVYGGTIEDYIRSATGSKGCTTSRDLRRMRERGIIEDDKVPNISTGRDVVVYKLPTNKNQLF